MRGLVLVFCLLFSFFSTAFMAQNHVSWRVNWDSKTRSIKIQGAIDPQWHLYSPKTKGDLGPVPLTVRFEPSAGIKLKGNLIYESEPLAHHDENFGGMVFTWEKEVNLSQNLKTKGEGEVIITLNYMVCDETRCLPPIDKKITLKISNP